jgi:hypothetical protein
MPGLIKVFLVAAQNSLEHVFHGQLSAGCGSVHQKCQINAQIKLFNLSHFLIDPQVICPYLKEDRGDKDIIKRTSNNYQTDRVSVSSRTIIGVTS